eukprot:1717621-Rhodomonas_salina.1
MEDSKDQLQAEDVISLQERVEKKIAEIESAGQRDPHTLHLRDILHERYNHRHNHDVVSVSHWTDDIPTLNYDKTFKQ